MYKVTLNTRIVAKSYKQSWQASRCLAEPLFRPVLIYWLCGALLESICTGRLQHTIATAYLHCSVSRAEPTHTHTHTRTHIHTHTLTHTRTHTHVHTHIHTHSLAGGVSNGVCWPLDNILWSHGWCCAWPQGTHRSTHTQGGKLLLKWLAAFKMASRCLATTKEASCGDCPTLRWQAASLCLRQTEVNPLQSGCASWYVTAALSIPLVMIHVLTRSKPSLNVMIRMYALFQTKQILDVCCCALLNIFFFYFVFWSLFL